MSTTVPYPSLRSVSSIFIRLVSDGVGGSRLWLVGDDGEGCGCWCTTRSSGFCLSCSMPSSMQFVRIRTTIQICPLLAVTVMLRLTHQISVRLLVAFFAVDRHVFLLSCWYRARSAPLFLSRFRWLVAPLIPGVPGSRRRLATHCRHVILRKWSANVPSHEMG